MSTPPNPQLDTTSRVDLTPGDWSLATWRLRAVSPAPPPAEFSLPTARARLRRVTAGSHFYAPFDWSRVGLANRLDPREAAFWFLAMTESSRERPPQQVADELDAHAANQPLGREEIRRRMRDRAGFLPQQILIPLANLFSPPDLADILLDPALCVVDLATVPHYQLSSLQTSLVEGVRHFVLPFLADAGLESLRERAREHIPSSLWSQGAPPTMDQFLAYRLAPLLGLHRELLALVSGWADNLFPARGGFDEWRRLPREIVFGLGDPWLVERHLRRLGLWLRHDQDARAWLAHTETRGLDYLVQSIRAGQGYNVTRLIDSLCLVEAPEAARPLLELRLDGQTCPAMREWFARQVGNAVAGLAPVAAGRGKLAEAARGYLREVRRRGLSDAIERHLPALEPAHQARIRQTILDVEEKTYPPLEDADPPDWLRQALLQMPQLPRDDLPDWVVEDDLPPLVLDGKRAGPALVRTVLRLCKSVKMECKPALFSALADHSDGPSREAFAWRLVEQWQFGGAPARDAWAMHAASWMGGDESVLRLASLLREWTGNAGRQRSGVALEALRAIGSPLALQQLSATARQGRIRQVRLQARSLFEQAAASHGLSRGELEDRAVPELGFAGEGGPTFDFGPRRFQALLAPGMRVLVRDAAGQVRPDLPAPGVRDDADSAKQAIADWRRLRRSVREVYKEQAVRLEQAMVGGQRWSLRHFRDRILAQPLLAQLAQLLLWAGYDERGRIACAFRITEDRAFVDADESPMRLLDLNSVRVVHPVEMNADTRSRWAEVWRDHELIAPFAQLGRRLFVPDERQRKDFRITAFRGRRVPALTIAGQVRARDWQPALIANRRSGEGHARYFASAGLTGVVFHPNVGAHVYPNHLAQQEIHAGFFVAGKIDYTTEIDATRGVCLGNVPLLVYGEVCETLAALYARGKE